MTQYKAIATVTWKFDSKKSWQECLDYAREQLEKILDCEPYGEEYDGFSVQMDIASMKSRKKLVHLGEFELDEVFPFVTKESSKKTYEVDGRPYTVRMNSDRYWVFKENNKCVSCGLAGNKMVLDLNPGDQSPHFNLYGEESGRLVLMTKDHIIPKSRGGSDELENFQTMCCVCNNLKGAYDLSLNDCRELRNIWNNNDKLPRKELRELINKVRENMSAGKEN